MSPTSDLAPAVLPLSADDRRAEKVRDEIARNPLAAAPGELLHDVWRVWVCFQHLFPSPLPIAGLVRCWVDQHELGIADAREILGQILAPECVGVYRFPADLTAALGAKVAAKLAAARLIAEQARVRAEREQAERERAANPPPSLAEYYAGLGRMPPLDRSVDRTNQAFADAVRSGEVKFD